MSTTTVTIPAGQVDCSTITNITDCLNRPNSAWDSTTGKCVCCSQMGDYYVKAGSGTTNPPVCVKCEGKCGNPKFCKGTIVNANAVCVENTTTAEWTAVCRNNAACGGECNGACGWSEWFAFSQCNITDGVYQCTVSFSQWKSWLWWIAVLIFLALLFLLIWYSTRRWADYNSKAFAVGTTNNGKTIVVPIEQDPVVATSQIIYPMEQTSTEVRLLPTTTNPYISRTVVN